jgi:hypothetical protein
MFRLVRSLRLTLIVSVAVASLRPLAPVRAQEVPSVDRRASIAVLDFNVTALIDPATWAPLAKGLPQMMMTELSVNPDLRLVERDRLQAVLDELKLTQAALVDPNTAQRVGKIIGAKYMLYGNTTVAPDKTLRFDLHAFEVETTLHKYDEKLVGKSGDLLELVGKLGQQFNQHFDPTPFNPPPRTSSTFGPTKEGLRLAMLLGNAVELKDRRDFEGAKTLVKQALALAPTNPSAKALLLSLDQSK